MLHEKKGTRIIQQCKLDFIGMTFFIFFFFNLWIKITGMTMKFL